MREAAAFGTAVVELAAIMEPELEPLVEHCAASPPDGFGYVSVHGPVGRLGGDWRRVVDLLQRLPPVVETVVLHPDLFGAEELALLLPLGRRLCFENMDVAKSDGRFADELERVFAACPDAGFCLDVAHVWTNDPSMALADELLDRFAGRLRQVHLSGIEPDGTHRETTAADVARYAPALARTGPVPVVLEAVLC